MIGQFAAFEQRPDNKLWLFYKKNGPYRLRKAYVLAYTWHEARAGALVAFHVALDEVEGKEIEKPSECLVEAGSTVVFVPISGTVYRIVETTVAMSGDDIRKLAVSSILPAVGEAVESDPAVRRDDDVAAKSLNGKIEADEVSGELFQSIQKRMQRLMKSSTYGKDVSNPECMIHGNAGCPDPVDENSPAVVETDTEESTCSSCGGLGYCLKVAVAPVEPGWSECAVCNSDEHIPWVMDVIDELKADKNTAYEERNRLVSLFASMALAMGWKAGIGQHEDKAGEIEPWDPEWRTLVVVETPEGQASWHFHDSHRALVERLPAYDVKWDGHDTDTKYSRLEILSRSIEHWLWAEKNSEIKKLRQDVFTANERYVSLEWKYNSLKVALVNESTKYNALVEGSFKLYEGTFAMTFMASFNPDPWLDATEVIAAERGVTLRGFERRTAKDRKYDVLSVAVAPENIDSHIVGGEFQSNKYPTTPRGKVPLSVKDKTAQDLLWEYAQRRRSVDVQFSDDLKSALRTVGYVHGAFGVYDCENCERLIEARDAWRKDARKWLADVDCMRPVVNAAVGYYESWKGEQRPDIAKRELLAAVRAYQDSETKQTAGECEPTTNPDDRQALSGSQSPALAGTPEASTLRGSLIKTEVEEEMERCIRIVDARTSYALGRHIIDEIRGSAQPEVQKLKLHSKYGRFGNWEACVDDATKEIIAKADDLAVRMSQIVSPASGAEGVIQLQENDIIVLERLIEAYKQISTLKEKR